MQEIANRVIEWSRENRVQLNADKCKELRISFAKEQRVFDPVIIEGKELELVASTKLLGLTITNDLTWNDHVTEITKKASKRLYFPTQLKRARVPKQDLALCYVSCVRSVIDYAAPVFFNGLPQYLKGALGRFPFDQIFRFEILGIPCDEWNSIFRCVGLTKWQSQVIRFQVSRENTRSNAGLFYLCLLTLGLLDDSEVEINDVLGEGDNITFIVRI